MKNLEGQEYMEFQYYSDEGGLGMSMSDVNSLLHMLGYKVEAWGRASQHGARAYALHIIRKGKTDDAG